VAKANSPDLSNLKPLACRDCGAESPGFRRAREKWPAGKYTVILEPAAVLDLVGFMFWITPAWRFSISARF